MDVTIRRIAPDEGDTLKHLRFHALADAPYAFATTLIEAQQKTDADWAADALRWSTDSTGATFFAESQGTVIAMVGVSTIGPNTELVAMWTAPEVRRQGIAAELVEAIAQWSMDAGATELWTAVADGNDAAATLYESVGFVASGQSRPMGSDEARTEWRYKRTLPPN